MGARIALQFGSNTLGRSRGMATDPRERRSIQMGPASKLLFVQDNPRCCRGACLSTCRQLRSLFARMFSASYPGKCLINAASSTVQVHLRFPVDGSERVKPQSTPPSHCSLFGLFCGGVPVPLSSMECGLPGASSTIKICALFTPNVAGANTTPI